MLWEVTLPADDMDRSRETVRVEADRYVQPGGGDLNFYTNGKRIGTFAAGSWDWVLAIDDDVSKVEDWLND